MIIVAKILTSVLQALYQPFWFALLLAILWMFFYLFAHDSSSSGKGWKRDTCRDSGTTTTVRFLRRLTSKMNLRIENTALTTKTDL